MPTVDLTPRLLGEVGFAGAASQWAASGAMALTGDPERAALSTVPAGVVAVLDALAGRLRRSTGIDVDGPALLGERAALTGLHRRGTVSCGGSTRLLPTADGHIAVALARADDVELLPAWLGDATGDDPWGRVGAAVERRRGVELVEAAGELGLAVGSLGERSGDRDAVLGCELAPAPPPAALHGVRVVDLSALWAGPLCGQLLALAGMDVVKVESSQRPDGARRGPGAFFDLLNAGKPSVVLDLGRRDGRAALLALIRTADVVIESSRPRALSQLGIDAAELVATGQVRVWVSITAHGRAERHEMRVGFGDDTAVAGGLVAGHPDHPVFCSDAAADPATGLLAATAAVDRLFAGGCWLLDVALARTAALLATGPTMRWDGAVAPPRARTVPGRASPLGQDTERVLGSIPEPLVPR